MFLLCFTLYLRAIQVQARRRGGGGGLYLEGPFNRGFFCTYLSNTPTNLCMALLNFSLFCFVLYCYAFVQYCNVKTIQYNAMHKFVGVLDNPLFALRVWGPYIWRGLYMKGLTFRSL